MLKTSCFTLLFICCNYLATGQDKDSITHINIDEVQIVQSRNKYFSEDKLVTIIDNGLMKIFSSSDINLLLSYATPSIISSYGGYGSVSSIQVRGSGVNHTMLNWNGIPMNSITLGSIDLSLIPVGFADEIYLTHGAAGSIFGGGTFGGSLALNNKADWNNRFLFEANMETASYNNHGAALKFSKGNSTVQYKVQVFYRRGDNKYKFTDNNKFGSPVANIEHNAYRNIGLLQNCYFRFGRGNIIETGLWLQDKDKEIPNILGEYGQSNANQNDRTQKAYILWKKIFSDSRIEAKTSYFKDFQRYTDKESASDTINSIESDILTHRIYTDINYRKYFTDKLVVEFGLSHSFLKGIVSSYGQQKTENQASIYSAAKYYFNNMIANLSLRQEYNEFVNPGRLFSVGLSKKTQNNKFLLRMNLSNKFRLPTFNEKYWKPGGNPDLLPEKGWSTEVGSEANLFGGTNSKMNLKIISTVYSSIINNWIQWVPGNPFWSPVNYKKVWARGLENALTLSYTKEKKSVKFNLSYDYCLSTNVDTYDNNLSITGKQLRYIPFHMAKSVIDFNYQKWNFGLLINYTGKRHTSMDNNPLYVMENYAITDIYLNKEFQINRFQCIVKFRVNNLMNVNYQVVKSYSMPGRMFYTELSFKINDKIKEK